jgi:hypothetical protein
MLSTGAVQTLYASWLNRAITWLNSKGYPVGADAVITTLKCGGDVVVGLKDTLYLHDWPYREGSHDKVDILASCEETVSLADGTCRKATVCVSYFVVKGEKATATESLHYDSLLPPQKKHPVCHVQCNCSLVKSPESFLRKRPDYSDEPIRRRLQHVRIPSAFVNLPGLVAILAADHMTEDHWNEFTRKCMKGRDKFPRIAKRVIVDKSIPEAHLCAWAWYEM